MDTETVLLSTIARDPADPLGWQALADALEEQGQTQRAELSRLSLRLRLERDHADGPRWQARVQELLASGVRPCVPELTNSIGMRFVLIPPGSFLMGSPPSERGRSKDEGPQHEVQITRPFYLGVFPVTQQEYQKVIGKNPSWFSRRGGGKQQVKDISTAELKRFPVEFVSWQEARTYLQKLSALPAEVKAGRQYRLPAEAEWEYACRGSGSSSSPFHYGASLSSRQANFNGNHPCGGAAKGPNLGRPCPVGSYQPNGFGLYDMHGNVWEWCADWYKAGYYAQSPAKDPRGPSRGSDRVYRGGGWNCNGRYCRSAFRDRDEPTIGGNFLGFRVALAPSGQ
jgi:uncharacterized protein (TIGR02996 family)